MKDGPDTRIRGKSRGIESRNNRVICLDNRVEDIGAPTGAAGDLLAVR